MPKNVVIIGRTNTGKSTLYNRLVGRRAAIVHHEPGTTRDRNESLVTWKGARFNIVDTGGWATDDEIFSEPVKKQLKSALASASAALFIVDAKTGHHPLDTEISAILRNSQKKVILVANKIDSPKDDPKTADFYRLGMGDPLPISANHGRNIYELLDRLSSMLKDDADAPEAAAGAIRVIFVGKPNVGKSSLVNRISDQERCIVHDVPGTTREALDTAMSFNGTDYILIDTPGLKRSKKFKSDLEYLSALSASHAVERSDVAVLVIDASEGLGETDAKIADMVIENKKACLIVMNKWDLIEDKQDLVRAIKQQLERKLKFIWWTKLLLVSAKTGQRTDKILKDVSEIYAEYSKMIPHDDLKEAIRQAQFHKPLSRHGEVLRIRDVSQDRSRPPTFFFSVNDTSIVHFSYKRYLENSLRKSFGFTGTPLILKFRKG
ncbi:MAG: ribosome biogenesis GTPase Der [Endomicrobiales bacterium]|nr:ribosome biogenesis GTPase Der [Endomicrobiales bacterium]